MDNAHQPVFRRHKVGVKNGDELALGRLHSFLQSSGLESVAIPSMMIGNRISQCCIALHDGTCDLDSLVRRIVEHLDIELLAWIFHPADGVY